MIGKSRRGRGRRDRIVKAILEQTSGVAIHVIPFNEPARTRDWRSLIPRGDWRGDAFAIGAVATTTLVLFFAQEWISSGPIDLLYLVPVIASASYFGFRSGLIAAIAAGVAYNFFFLPPFYTFIIYVPQTSSPRSCSSSSRSSPGSLRPRRRAQIRHRGETDAQGVLSAGRTRRPSRQGPDAHASAARDLGTGACRQRRIPARHRQGVAQEAVGRPVEPERDPQRAWHRLSVTGTGRCPEGLPEPMRAGSVTGSTVVGPPSRVAIGAMGALPTHPRLFQHPGVVADHIRDRRPL